MNHTSSKSLHDRFKEFLETLAEVENIDNLSLTKTQRDANKADYFAKNRELIIELKSLESDTEYKVADILETHKSRPEFPMFYGEWEIEKILNHLPDKDAINRQLVEAVTSSLKEIYRKANKQIRTTKATFDLPNSQGLLIILNEKIDVLAPEHIDWQLRKMLSKRHPDGSFQFPEINYILIIIQAHFKRTKNNLIGFPMLHLPVGIVCEFQHVDFVDFLCRKWTEYIKVPLIEEGNVNSVKELNLKSVKQGKKLSETTIPRHEAWRRHYRQSRYLERRDEEYLKWFFKMVFTELVSGLLIGATAKQRERVKYWGEIYTHFLEEINIRGLDFKIFLPVLKSIDFGEENNENASNIFNSSVS